MFSIHHFLAYIGHVKCSRSTRRFKLLDAPVEVDVQEPLVFSVVDNAVIGKVKDGTYVRRCNIILTEAFNTILAVDIHTCLWYEVQISFVYQQLVVTP